MSIVEIIYTPKKKPVLNTVHLVLKYKWYDMITSGEKTEEYCAINTWQRRFGKNIKYNGMSLSAIPLEGCSCYLSQRKWGGAKQTKTETQKQVANYGRI